MAWASSVAVVVPSPAVSEVLLATSRTICAPIFSNLSSSSISFATVTPSLVMRGAPNDFSSTTLRPLAERHLDRIGQDVDAAEHALAGILGKFYFLSWHGPSPVSSAPRLGGLLFGDGAFKHAKNVAFFHDQQLFAIELDLGAGPLAEQHAVAWLHIEWLDLPLSSGAPGPTA